VSAEGILYVRTPSALYAFAERWRAPCSAVIS